MRASIFYVLKDEWEQNLHIQAMVQDIKRHGQIQMYTYMWLGERKERERTRESERERV